MKTKFLALAVLVIAAVGAFAFKAETAKRTGVLFQLTTAGTPDAFDPLDYVTYSGTDPVGFCPNSSKICVIDVSSTDVYTAANAPTPAHIGKPKVDINTAASNELFDQIQAAIANAGEQNPLVPVNGRIIYEKN